MAVVVIPARPTFSADVQNEEPMPVTSDQVIDALRPVEDPELRRSIVDLGMVRGVDVRPDGVVGVLVALTVPGCPLRNEIERRVSEAVLPLDGVSGVSLDFTVMTDAEREALRLRLHGDPGATAGAAQAHGHAEGRQIPFAQPGSIYPDPAHIYDYNPIRRFYPGYSGYMVSIPLIYILSIQRSPLFQ